MKNQGIQSDMSFFPEQKKEADFDELVHEYLGPVFGFLMTLVRDRDTAEDLVQETFLRAWKHRTTLDSTGNIKSWLFKIAKNAALDYFKKKKALPFSLFETPEGGNVLDQIPDEALLPDELVMKLEDRVMFDGVLGGLSLRSQGILQLVYREELSLHEIATLFDVSYNTVKSQHRRALQELHKAAQGFSAPKKPSHS